MKTLEQLQEKSLKANFTEVQQAHFDKLMSELEQISDGLGFAELKAKAEAGSKKALQIMRDYVAKKEQIVEFIETKEIPKPEGFQPVEITELEVGDEVVLINATESPGEPKQFTQGKIVRFNSVGTPQVFFPDLNISYGYNKKRLAKISINNKFPSVDMPILELHDYKEYKIGDKYKRAGWHVEYILTAIGIRDGDISFVFCSRPISGFPGDEIQRCPFEVLKGGRVFEKIEK